MVEESDVRPPQQPDARTTTHPRWPPTVQGQAYAFTPAPRGQPRSRQCITTISSDKSSPLSLSCLATPRCRRITLCNTYSHPYLYVTFRIASPTKVATQ